jgi:non-ribosomal peptide synthetase component E (peptide arylation enzyme)
VLSYSIEGRMKDLIDRGGEKINAEEVELLIAGHPAVAEIALIGMPDPRLGERGCAYVVPRDPQNPPASALTWRMRAWPSTSGPNASNSSTRCRAPRSGRSPR